MRLIQLKLTKLVANQRIDASPLNVSAQFLVDQDGKIYRLLPETTMAGNR